MQIFSFVKGLTSGKNNPFYVNPKYFWDQLQLVIDTEEDVHIRREVIELYVYALFDSSKSCDYMSGSKGDFCFSGVTLTS